ncbi:MAG: dicarboxylate/amino acid:cation symporter [Nitrospiria bacterium]
MSANVKLLAGLLIGALAGLGARWAAVDHPEILPWVERLIEPIGRIFLRLLFMLVVPLLFSALVMGISGLELRGAGRLGAKTLGYAFVFSVIAVVIGVGLVNLVRPGDGGGALRALSGAAHAPVAAPIEVSPASLIGGLVPDNPVKAAAAGDMVGLIVFSVIFGLGLAVTRTAGAARLREAIEGLYDVMMTLIAGVMRLAPVGVAALVCTMTARLGLDLLGPLLAYVGVVLLALLIQLLVVYSAAVRLLGGRSPLAFFRDVRLAMATAFATSSSSATLPTALIVAEEHLKLPRHISRFVLTAGSAMNQNGTALFEGITVLFLAQLFDVHLGLGQQLLIMGICILAGVGTAGVPAGSLPVIATILVLVGIPVEGLGLILGVDRLLDMCRTTVNVTGDLAVAVIIARHEAGACP